MKYWSGTGTLASSISFSLTRQQQCTLEHERTSWPPSFDVKPKIRLRQSMRIYVKNICAKFHQDGI